MLKHFLLIVIFLLISVDSLAGGAKITHAKIRGDGNLVDKDNFIIGIRNPDDERANPGIFYYYGVDREGNVTDYSVYRVYQNPAVKWPDFLQERLVDEVKDYSEVLTASANAENVIMLYDDEIFFNGRHLNSGDVASGGIVTYIRGKLRYNGKLIQSGTKVLHGEIVEE